MLLSRSQIMPDSHRFDREPAEGSREVVEHELKKSGPPPSPSGASAGPEDGDVFDMAREDIEGRGDEPSAPPEEATEHPPSGPHASPDLTNEEATPGAGTLPDPDQTDVEAVSS
jgi:hypothetical protein